MNTSFLSRIARILGAVAAALTLRGLAQPDPAWIDHDRNRPMPPAVDPGVFSTAERVGKAPADAVVLFDGKDLSSWVAMDGSPTKWVVKNGAMECVPGSGYVRTLRNFGDCQLHVEWATPTPAHGEGQGRGNSGVFLGLDRYEIQVLDSYESKTYADGSAGSVYGQYPPLVNVCRPPGEWQVYDIIYTAPRFDPEGKLLSPARITALQNGVLIQNNVALTGPTGWLDRLPYQPHPEKQPISFQDHGNPVRYRNVWVREVGQSGKPELSLAQTLLESYAGTYDVSGGNQLVVARDGAHLTAQFAGRRFVLFAETSTRFFAKTTDVQVVFQPGPGGKVDQAVVSVGEGGMEAKRVK